MLLHQRKRNRLPHFDYSQAGWYYVTICVYRMEKCLGEVRNNKLIPNSSGRIVIQTWQDLPNHYSNCYLDKFVLMPNHLHGIIIISYVGNGFKPFPTTYSLSEIVRGFKTFSSRQIHEQLNQNYFRWQKSFYDHVIRNEKSLWEIRRYIEDNPRKWQEDKYHTNFFPFNLSGKNEEDEVGPT